MRDVERLREKIEFSLDGKQAWALAFSALLLLGGVFTIGLLVGRRTAPAPQTASGDLATLDAESRPQAAPKPAAPEGEPVKETLAPEKADKPSEKHDTQGRAPMVVPPAHAATVVPPPQTPVKVASSTPVVLTSPPKDVGNFTVQIGASQDRADALRMENKARAAGLKPYVVEADLGAKGTWYRVRVGVFKDKDAANDYRRDVERELRAPAVVMPAK